MTTITAEYEALEIATAEMKIYEGRMILAKIAFNKAEEVIENARRELIEANKRMLKARDKLEAARV
jgi:hypothetical protein